MNCRCAAIARVRGNGIVGTVRFYPQCGATLVTADICGLPQSETGFFAFHIHEGASCCGENFSDTGGHYNPGGMPHPCHAGDLPPLLSRGGEAQLSVVTGRFLVDDVIGRTVVIHSGPDDFTTQPAGNPGQKIACGVICRVHK